MTVYYFQRSTLDLAIKIGFTDRPIEQRKREIETSLGTPIDLIGSEPGTRALERARHEQFDDLRIGGEWFLPDPRLYDFLREHVVPKGITDHPAWTAFVDEAAQAFYDLLRVQGIRNVPVLSMLHDAARRVEGRK